MRTTDLTIIGAPPEGAQRRFSDGSAEAWAERADALRDSTTVRIGAAIHSMRAVDPEAAAVVAAWARERDRPLHAPLSEQPAEHEACREAYGRTLSALLAEAGALTGKLLQSVCQVSYPAGPGEPGQWDVLAGVRLAPCRHVVRRTPRTRRPLRRSGGPLDGAI